MSSSVCWLLNATPNTLCNVGVDVVAMCSHSIICFTHMKTKEKTYYVCADPTRAGLDLFAGHNRFPIFAFVENTMTPTIHVIIYPDMTPFISFPTRSVLKYSDLVFSEYGYVIALTGHPDYSFRIWNFRTGNFMCEVRTGKFSSKFSLLTSNHNLPLIVQYSEWMMELNIWEVCLTAEKYTLHRISKKTLNDSYELSSKQENMCFSEDNNIYLVNDLGHVFSYEMGEFYFKFQWAPLTDTQQALAHKLYSGRGGLAVLNVNTINFIRKEHKEWILEWTFEQTASIIEKLVYNHNNDFYGTDKFGNISRLDLFMDTIQLAEITTDNCLVESYVTLKGQREELLLLLLKSGELRLVDFVHGQKISKYLVPDVLNILAHPTHSFVIVSTKTGLLHLLSYERIRTPIVVNTLDLECGAITHMKYNDDCIVAYDSYGDILIVTADFKASNFALTGKIVADENDIYRLLDILVIDEKSAILFTTRKPMQYVHHADELWILAWKKSLKGDNCKRTEFNLPTTYRMFTFNTTAQRDTIEIYGATTETNYFDGFTLTDGQNLVWTLHIRTHHLCAFTGISGSKNFLTWGLHTLHYHLRSDKRSPKPYVVTKRISRMYPPQVLKRLEEVYNGKFLLTLYNSGIMSLSKSQPIGDNVQFNSYERNTPLTIKSKRTQNLFLVLNITMVEEEPTDEEKAMRKQLLVQLSELSKEVSKLIDFDISVTQKNEGIFSKFCLNYKWRSILEEQAKTLCKVERQSLNAATADQARIRDWILAFISRNTFSFSCKLRAIYNNQMFENFSLQKPVDKKRQMFELYRLYDMEPYEDDMPYVGEEAEADETDIANKPLKLVAKPRKRFIIQGNSVYDHVMAPIFYMQDENVVTMNQMRNEMAKFQIILVDALQSEFNKKFVEMQKIKQESIDNILNMNATLEKIYSNMNIMLRLLRLHQFKPPKLIFPEWSNDEMLERILTVDDSEIKAINRRKKKDEIAAYKSGRMLLWPVEFWERALQIMMDGVLEKLWEEEIKKDIPLPEFYFKKDATEYTLEEHRAWREYEEKVLQLQKDRRKYLNILRNNELHTKELKKNYILKTNEKISQMATLKLKYDFAIRHNRLRIFNLQLQQHNRIKLKKELTTLHADLKSINQYVDTNEFLAKSWDKSVNGIKEQLDALITRDKALERSMRTSVMNSLPTNLGYEIMRLYKRRPKTNKSFNSTLVYQELANFIGLQPKPGKIAFPLPDYVKEFANQFKQMDDLRHCPHLIDVKYWDYFIKMRRLKLENELKIKGVQCQLYDAHLALNIFKEDILKLNKVRSNVQIDIDNSTEEFNRISLNPRVQITLNMGQVEVLVGGYWGSLDDCILINMNDLTEINENIKRAGDMKIRMMQKVAMFRRKVLYKEWEHKVTRANIEYLTYMLQIIANCKVTYEFLEILRNWKRVRANRDKMITAGYFEKVVEQKIAAYRRNLVIIIEKINATKEKIVEMKQENMKVNKKIEALKVDVAFSQVRHDELIEHKFKIDRAMRFKKIITRSKLAERVRSNHMKIMELTSILNIKRMHINPMLPPDPPQCIDPLLPPC